MNEQPALTFYQAMAAIQLELQTHHQKKSVQIHLLSDHEGKITDVIVTPIGWRTLDVLGKRLEEIRTRLTPKADRGLVISGNGTRKNPFNVRFISGDRNVLKKMRAGYRAIATPPAGGKAATDLLSGPSVSTKTRGGLTGKARVEN